MKTVIYGFLRSFKLQGKANKTIGLCKGNYQGQGLFRLVHGEIDAYAVEKLEKDSTEEIPNTEINDFIG